MQFEKKILESNEKYSILSGVAASASLSLANNYFTLFAILVLGATNYQVGLISSLPQIVGMVAILPAAYFVNKAKLKKGITSYSIFFTRLTLILMAFVVFVPAKYAAWVFVVLIALMNFPGQFLNLSFQAFLADIIPEERRNLFFAKRNRILTITGLIVTLTVGIFMKTQLNDDVLPYQILFVLAFIAGMFEMFYVHKHKEFSHPNLNQEIPSFFSKKVFGHKPYLTFLICGLFFNFAWQMAWPLFSIFQIRNCHANGLWISLFNVSNQLTQIISYPIWAKLGSKYSNSSLLVVTSIGMGLGAGLTPLFENLYWLIFVNIISGFFVSGTVLLLFNGLLEASKEEIRTSFVANYNFLLAFVAFVAPQFGVFLEDLFDIKVAMLISMFLRFVGGGLFLWMGWYLKKHKEHPQIQLMNN
ncbi:MAG: major facilitator superfamily permease [Bacillales bacterium]|nr:major facilitator superfamily permease [Bacillales bacterium]